MSDLFPGWRDANPVTRERLENHEGWWESTPQSICPDLHGKLESERWADHVRLNLLVRDLSVADGEQISVVAGNEVVLTAIASGGDAILATRSTDPQAVVLPRGTVVELRCGGSVLATAVMEDD